MRPETHLTVTIIEDLEYILRFVMAQESEIKEQN